MLKLMLPAAGRVAASAQRSLLLPASLTVSQNYSCMPVVLT